MTAIFELHLPSETLAADELSEITERVYWRLGEVVKPTK